MASHSTAREPSLRAEEGDEPGAENLELDRESMLLALEEARRAEALDEVPIGTIVLLEGAVIGRGFNQTRMRADPTAHAEMLALREACQRAGAMRLPGAVVYSTVEPCFMCAGALSHARVARVVFGVRDPKFGGCVSLGRVLSDDRLNHRALLCEGVCAETSRALLQKFFRNKR